MRKLAVSLACLMVCYRVLSLDHEVDVEEGDYFKYDITQGGLGIGVGFSF